MPIANLTFFVFFVHFVVNPRASLRVAANDSGVSSDSACVRLPLARPDAAGAAVEYGGTFEGGARFGGVPATGNGG